MAPTEPTSERRGVSLGLHEKTETLRQTKSTKENFLQTYPLNLPICSKTQCASATRRTGMVLKLKGVYAKY